MTDYPGATWHDNPGTTIAAGATIGMNRLVKGDGTYCGVDTTRDWIGQTTQPMSFIGTTVASGERVGVRFTHAGSMLLTADGAIPANSVVYKGANGKVSATATGSTRVGILAPSAVASADGDLVEVIPD